MPRKKNAQPAPAADDSAATDIPPPGSKVSKVDAVRYALKAGRVLPKDGIVYIQEQFGIDMPKTQFSSNKSQILAKDREDAKRNAPKRAGRPPKSASAPQSDPVEAARAIKELVDKFGPKTVRGLVALFTD